MSQTIRVNVALYGSLASRLGKRYVAAEDIELPIGICKAELLQKLGISDEDRGYLFINAVLCDVPGLSTGDGQVLENGDHVGIFSVDRIWPYQYRDGVRMSPALTEAMQKHGPMHHSYHLELGDANISEQKTEELQNGKKNLTN